MDSVHDAVVEVDPRPSQAKDLGAAPAGPEREAGRELEVLGLGA